MVTCVYILPKLQSLNIPSRLFCYLVRLAATNRHLVLGWGHQCWHRRESLPHSLRSGRSHGVSTLEKVDWLVFLMVEKGDTETYHLSQLTLCPVVGSVGSATCWTPLFSRRADYVSLCYIQTRSNLARLLLCMTHCTQELPSVEDHLWLYFCQSFLEFKMDLQWFTEEQIQLELDNCGN